MNIATRQKLSALRALVDHLETPEHECRSARARIAEIGKRVREEDAKKRTGVREGMPTGIGELADSFSRRGLAGFKRRVRDSYFDVEKIVHDDWPFGWDGARELQEHESGHGFNGEYILGWKCPDCGSHVTRVIDSRMMLRFAANPDALQGHVDRIIGAETNHLCADCWRKWSVR